MHVIQMVTGILKNIVVLCKLMGLGIVNRIDVVESNPKSEFDRRFRFQRFNQVGDRDFDLKSIYFR